MRTLSDRFFEKIQPITETGCWIWMGHVTYFGHGQIKHEGAACLAHRISYALHNGDIQDGLVVRHTCDIACCVNPAHLILGTQADNVRDISKRGRMNAASLVNLLRGNKSRRDRKCPVLI